MKLSPGMARGGAWTVRIAVSAVFAIAAIEKLRAPAAFVENIANYQILPEWSPIAALTIPPVELLAATALLLAPRRWRLAGAATLLGLLAMFTVSLTRAWWIGLNVDCGCFGQGSSTAGPWSIARNLTLIASLVLLVRFEDAPSRAGGALPLASGASSLRGRSTDG